MKIVIIGVSGFIGQQLARELTSSGHEITGLSRSPRNDYDNHGQRLIIRQWDGKSSDALASLLEGKDGVVNLAGENIAAGIWTKKRKQHLVDSRVRTGRTLADAFLQLPARPTFLVQGSAAGFYGPHPDGMVDETAPAGAGFLADLVQQWEMSVTAVRDAGVRTVFIRTGIVLGQGGGMLPQILRPFTFYAGTTPGSGKQWVSWIHMKDQVSAIHFLIKKETSSGAYNLTSPSPVTMRELISKTAEETGRPAWVGIPDFALRAGLGEMARETILASQQIYPGKLLKEGFIFGYGEIGKAIHDLLSRSRP